MYVLNIDILPVSINFKKKLEEYYTVIENDQSNTISCEYVVGIYCRFAKLVDENLIKKYPNLRFIACNATGIQHIDKKACERSGVTIYSLENSAEFLSQNVTSSAEHTWCLALASARNLKSHQNALNNKIFDRNRNFGIQLKDKTLGLIGIGRNGQQIARYATAFSMQIKYYDPYKIVPEYEKISSLKDLFSVSDVVVISCTLTDETRNLVDLSVLKTGNSLILINTSRGEIVCESHVLQALDQGYLASYATDVISNESEPLKSEIYRQSLTDERVLITPHIAGATMDAWNITEGHLADMIINAGHKI